MTCGGENGTNGCHLAILSEDIAFAHHFVAPHLPPSHPIGALVVLAMPVKKLSKMVGNSANYPVYSRRSKLTWIAIDLWRNTCRMLQSFLRYIELNISKLYFWIFIIVCIRPLFTNPFTFIDCSITGTCLGNVILDWNVQQPHTSIHFCFKKTYLRRAWSMYFAF